MLWLSSVPARSRTIFAGIVRSGSSLSLVHGKTPESTTLYVNPMCMQMDQALLKCSTPDEVLTALVTHRGVMFVHNLITSIEVLADFSTQSMEFSVAKKYKFPSTLEKCEKEKLLEDPRYSLLLRDLMDNAEKLDVQSIDRILKSLYTLNHCQYRLIGTLLKRLYAMDISSLGGGEHAPSGIRIDSALSIGTSLDWAGFGRAETFFTKLSTLLESRLGVLTRKDFVNSVLLFSRLPNLYIGLFDKIAQESIVRSKSFSAFEGSVLALGLSSYGPSVSSSIVPAVNELVTGCVVGSTLLSASMRDLVRYSIALRRVNVYNVELMSAAIERVQSELSESKKFGEKCDPSVATISDISHLVESISHFGRSDILANFIGSFVLPYVADHIDAVTEESAVRLLYAMSVVPECVSGVRATLNTQLLFRKIGHGTKWEKMKSKIISIFFSKCMYWPSVESEIPKFILDECLAHWLRSRRGYGLPFPEEGDVLFKAVKDASGGLDVPPDLQFNAWIPNSPYTADILIPSQRVAVLVLSQFDAVSGQNPVGTDVLQCDHVKSLGWHVVPINRNWIREVNDAKSVLSRIPRDIIVVGQSVPIPILPPRPLLVATMLSTIYNIIIFMGHRFRTQIGQMELITLGVICVMIAAWVVGSVTNRKIATNHFAQILRSLESHFLVPTMNGKPTLFKESASHFFAYSTGRRNCSGMVSSIHLDGRQDLLGKLVASRMLPSKGPREYVEFEIQNPDIELSASILICRKFRSKIFCEKFAEISKFGKPFNGAIQESSFGPAYSVSSLTGFTCIADVAGKAVAQQAFAEKVMGAIPRNVIDVIEYVYVSRDLKCIKVCVNFPSDLALWKNVMDFCLFQLLDSLAPIRVTESIRAESEQVRTDELLRQQKSEEQTANQTESGKPKSESSKLSAAQLKRKEELDKKRQQRKQLARGAIYF